MIDVAVIGAGPAGAACALALKKQKIPVLLLGPNSKHPANTLELLSGRALDALLKIGLYDAVTYPATPCAGITSSWGGRYRHEQPAMLNPHGGGWIVDRSVLDPTLRAHAVAAGVEYRAVIVRSLARVAGGWLIHTADEKIHCRRVILATGRRSKLPSQCGLQWVALHQLVAITAWVGFQDLNLSNELWVDDAEQGWWWALGRDSGVSIGYCTDADLLRSCGDKIDITWQRLLRESRCRSLKPEHPRIRLALTGYTSCWGDETLNVIGDAALAVDPLSGHGLTLAFLTSWQAVSDPFGYAMWIEETRRKYAEREREIYASAQRSGAFWERRGGPNS